MKLNQGARKFGMVEDVDGASKGLMVRSKVRKRSVKTPQIQERGSQLKPIRPNTLALKPVQLATDSSLILSDPLPSTPIRRYWRQVGSSSKMVKKRGASNGGSNKISSEGVTSPLHSRKVRIVDTQNSVSSKDGNGARLLAPDFEGHFQHPIISEVLSSSLIATDAKDLANQNLHLVLENPIRYSVQRVYYDRFALRTRENPDVEFEVHLGPQTCTCMDECPCLHLIYVLVVVFRMPSSSVSSLLLSGPLSTPQVENLLAMFETRRSHHFSSGIEAPWSARSDSDNEAFSNHSNENSCWLCYWDLDSKESNGDLNSGDGIHTSSCCGVTAHSECVNLWTRDQTLLCPGCQQHLWHSSSNRSNRHQCKLEKGFSPQRFSDLISLPNMEAIEHKDWTTANPWMGVLGRDVVACLLAKDWIIRETALRRLSQELSTFSMGDFSEKFQRCVLDVLAKMVVDKVFKVYFAAIQCMRLVLRSLPPQNDISGFTHQLKPVLQGILQKCADGNKRVADLSTEVLMELATSGFMPFNRFQGIEGNFALDFILQLILEAKDLHLPTCSRTMGRLLILEKLLSELEQEFSIQGLALGGTHSPTFLQEKLRSNHDRLMIAIDISFSHLQSKHSNIIKTSRQIFMTCAKLAVKSAPVFRDLCHLLSALEPTFQIRLRKRLLTIAATSKEGLTDQYLFLDKLVTKNAHLHQKCSSQMTSYRSPYARSSSMSPSRRQMNPLLRGSSASPSRKIDSSSQSFRASVPVLLATVGQKMRGSTKLTHLDMMKASGTTDRSLPYRPASNNCSNYPMERLSRSQGSSSDPWGFYLEGKHWTKGTILGSGAFSSCSLARDQSTGTIMAVKQISLNLGSTNDEQIRNGTMIRDEIALLSQIHHPHVVRFFGAVEEGFQVNLFMEWMPGGSVAKLLEVYGPFNESITLRYAFQVLLGLEYLHAFGILHRDLKGANLLVDSTGTHLRIGDFGAASRFISGANTFDGTQGSSSASSGSEGQLQGTIAFMAPEVLRGKVCGPSCDVWSLGCCIIEMNTSKPPWNTPDISNHLALIYKITRSPDPPSIPANMSLGLKDLTMLCLSRDPQSRPSSEALLLHNVFGHI
ncbi:hypothetical protein TCAL_05429 [Tigriopus californicus]|uniref:Protein kinase domain-containing protein n=1 Tax=Tigriopus californicus TaxID=6832 RepID=A0A553NXA0_TIGCA|nr:hypothetical protein TCAL_05429 [Tigriopus californicus]